MPFLPDNLVQLINSSKDILAEQRLEIFEELAKYVSLIPIRGGFPNENEDPRSYKAASITGWAECCTTKRLFNKNEFAPERAALACGPANGVLVLDIDDWEKFNAWTSSNSLNSDFTTFLVQSSDKRGHVYYRYPNDGNEYRNKRSKNGFDVRGVGGYVLCPGSLHPETKALYTIINNVALTDAPQWLIDYILEKGSPNKEKREITDQFINSLPISNEQKLNILNGFPKGNRSEKSMETMIALVANNVTDENIKEIYEKYPIGEKVRENGDKWFFDELARAKEYAIRNNIPALQNKNTSQENNHTITIYTALDVIERNISFEFMIENIWPKGEPLLITGIGGVGKSLMTLQLVMDLVNPPANGFLDTYKITNPNEKHRVLFIQSENSFTGMKKRFSVIRDSRSGYSIDNTILKESIFFAGVGNDITTLGNLEDKAFIDSLSRKVEEAKADIIVVDPLISFHHRDENSNDQMRKVLDILSEFCRNMKVTPLLVHHHGKMASESGQGGGRGASAIGDWSPNTWELSKSKEGHTFAPKKTRNFEMPSDIKLELNYLRFHPRSGSGNKDTFSIVIQALSEGNGKFDKKSDFTTAIKKILESKNKDIPSDNTIGSSYIDPAVKKGLVAENQSGRSKSYEVNKEAVKKHLGK